jgi:hypothetical protein
MTPEEKIKFYKQQLLKQDTFEWADVRWLVHRVEQLARYVDSSERGNKYQFEQRRRADDRAAAAYQELRRAEAKFSTEVDNLRETIVELWHKPELLDRPLHEVLGMTEQEYGRWAIGATQSYGW